MVNNDTFSHFCQEWPSLPVRSVNVENHERGSQDLKGCGKSVLKTFGHADIPYVQVLHAAVFFDIRELVLLWAQLFSAGREESSLGRVPSSS